MTDHDLLLDGLRDALGRLYDPLATVPDAVVTALGVPAGETLKARERLQLLIRSMEPGGQVPVDTRDRRLYDILRMRYLEHLTQEETALRLAITVRHLAREQAAAIELLAQRLCTLDWIEEREVEQTLGAQVEAEVAALGTSARAASSVSPAIEQVLELIGGWCAQRGVAVRLAVCEPDVAVAVHPSVLHQILIATVSYLVRTLDRGTVELAAEEHAGKVLIQAVARPAVAEPLPADWVAAELIETQGGTLKVSTSVDSTVLQVTLPSAQSLKVLVLDDNPDLVHFYQLCLSGTSYRMVPLAEGRLIFEVIAREHPSAIVLDLMLPDVDGWELLSQLHEHPASRGIPVIVCSVVHEEDLALALGAAACVNKPVRRQQLVNALDAALSLAAS